MSRPVPGRLHHGRQLLHQADHQLSVRVPHPPLGARRRGAADPPADRPAPAGRVRHSHPEGEETEDPRRPGRAGVRGPYRGVHEGPGVRPDAHHQRAARPRGPVADAAESGRLAGHAGDRPPAAALAPPPLQRHPTLLLPDRGGRDADLAHRGRAAARPAREDLPRPPRSGQRRGQPGAGPAGPEARHRGRQDHRHGDDHRLADGQRGAPSRQPALQPRIPRRDPRPHHS